MALACTASFAQRTADEEVKTLRTPPGFEISLFASEPLITNPSAIDIDTHGRVWVAEIQWYRAAAKNPPADSIKVLEDTDGDGRADKATTFAEGIFAPMSVCVAGDKVYVATSPDLWVYEDKDGDLKADGSPTKLLTGFGGFNHDHGAHSLVLGPDHKWWMSHGDTGFNVTGTDGSHIQFQWGAMLRGELDGSKLETIAVNFRNPYEICVSSFGEAFCSDNDNDGNFSVRIPWILEGGNYGWFGRPPFAKEELPTRVPPGTPFGEHWHFRGFIPGYVPAMLVTGFGSPCGICYYEGDAFGPAYKNAPLHCDAGPREVRIYRHENAGFGMKGSSENVVVTEGDDYFRPDDVCAAPDGSLYVSDWYDGGVGGHAYNDPNRGRIFLLRPAGQKLARTGRPGPYANVGDAMEGLKNPNLATQYLARVRLLAEGEKCVPELKALAADAAADPNHRARALWVLDRIGGKARDLVRQRLADREPSWRALVVRILRRHGGAEAPGILALAGDASAEVRREVLLAVTKLDDAASFDVLAAMAARFDGSDRYELETINIAAAQRKEQLYAQLEKQGKWSLQQLPLMQLLNPRAASDFLMTGLAKNGLDEATGKLLLEAAGNIPAVEAGRGILDLVANRKAPADLRALALAKLTANLSGVWKDLAADKRLAATFKELLAEKDLQRPVLEAIANPGLDVATATALAPDVLALAESSKVPSAVRQQAIGVAAKLKPEGLAGRLLTLLSDDTPEVRSAALAALVDQQDARSLREVLSGRKVSPELASAAVERLMQTTGGAIVALRLIDEKALPETLQQAAIALAVNHPDSNVRVLFERFVPENQRPQRLGAAIKPEEIMALSGNAGRGEQIFFQSTAAQCKNCHRVQGIGGSLGPDLSQIGKKYETKTLLETILDPSKAIAPEFIPYLLETSGGLVFAGFIVEKNDQQVVLKDAKSELVRVPAAEIEALAPQQKSLMPELVLRDVTAQDAADLLAYLASLTHTVVHTGAFRVLGPFDSADGQGLDRDFGPEGALASPDLKAEFKGVGGKTNHWDLVQAADAGGYLAVDQVKYSQSRGLPADKVTNYFLVYADSAGEQNVELLIGSDDSCRVWVGGEEVHRFKGSRAVGYAQDRAKAKLKAGRNAIVIKVENYNGPGGVALSIAAPAPVQLATE